MGRTAARLLVGMGLVVVALLAGRGASVSGADPVAEVPEPGAEADVVVVRATIAPDGTLGAPQPDVTASRVGDGRYLVVVPGTNELLVTSWEAVARVVVTPVGADVTMVAFVDSSGRPVNTGFSVAAS